MPLTIREAIRKAAARLKEAGSDEAELEARLLLGYALGMEPIHYHRLNDRLNADEEEVYEHLLQRRLAHEPTAYIVGHKEFYGLEFEVTPVALIPRPETETLVELAIGFVHERFGDELFTLVDVGAGCGTIAVPTAKELPNARVVAIDVSDEALQLAARNAARHGVAGRIAFVQGDLLEPVKEQAGLIAANLPYVITSDWEQLPPEIREREPRQALDGGPDGLRLIKKLLAQAPGRLIDGGALLAEIGDEQGQAASAIARKHFPAAIVEVRQDLTGRDRVLVVRV